MTESVFLRILIWKLDKKVEINIFQLLFLLFSLQYWVAIFYAQDHELALEEALKITILGLVGFLAVGLKLEFRLKLLKVCIWAGSGIVLVGVLY